MADLEISSLVFTYEWELTDVENKPMTILSKTIKFCGQLSFRLGLKNSQYPTLFFIAINLNKLGMKVTNVTYISSTPDDDPRGKKRRERMELKDQEDDEGSIQLYTDVALDDIVTGSRKFTFNIYLEGIVKSYQIQRWDYLCKQLWSNRFGTDFEFIAEGKRFPVHKFVLAARSPVFAVLFGNEMVNQGMADTSNQLDNQPGESPTRKRLRLSSNYTTAEGNITPESKTVPQQIVEPVDAGCMEQFLKFLYFGQLEEPVSSRKLKYLAETYRIKTLISICIAAASKVDGDKLASLALDFKDGEISLKIAPDEDSEIDFGGVAAAINFTLDVKREEKDQKSWARSKTFDYRKEKLFRVEAKIVKTESEEDDPPSYKISLVFLGLQLGRMNCRIREVGYSDESGDDYWNEPVTLEEIPTSDENLLQKFTRTDEFSSPPNSITFHIQLESTLSNFDYDFVDSAWKDQFWGALSTNKLTDVVLIVGNDSINAHRSILSARSPIFAAMFKSGMSECQTSRVHIEDVDPTTFREFLKFLYTGMLEPSADKEELLVLADKYHVETLEDCCKSATQSVDVEELTKVFLSC